MAPWVIFWAVWQNDVWRHTGQTTYFRMPYVTGSSISFLFLNSDICLDARPAPRPLDNIQMENVNYYSILLSFHFHSYKHTPDSQKRCRRLHPRNKKSINWQTLFWRWQKYVDYASNTIKMPAACWKNIEKLTKKHSILRRTCSYAIIPKSFIIADRWVWNGWTTVGERKSERTHPISDFEWWLHSICQYILNLNNFWSGFQSHDF